MACKSYDEEDRKYARDLFCASDYRSMDRLVEQMRTDVPDRYSTLRKATVLRWRKKDSALGIDWAELRAERQRKRAERQNSLAEVQVDDILDQVLRDMQALRERVQERIEANAIKDGKDLTQLSFAYLKATDRVLDILRGKVREVDLSRITHESQVFFIRKVFEDIGRVTGEVDETLSAAWKQHNQSLLARLRGMYSDRVITDVSRDLCLEAIIERAKKLDDDGYLKADPDGSGTPGYHGRAGAAAD